MNEGKRVNKVLQQRLFIKSGIRFAKVSNEWPERDPRLSERCSYTNTPRAGCGCSDCVIVYSDVRILKRID